MSTFRRLITSLHSDTVGGSLLIVAALTGLLWANSPLAESYEELRSFSFGPQALHLKLSVQEWASDGLLTLFFFIVGNELKQELVHGELRDPRRAVLPIAAALGGVVVPVLLFFVVNASASPSVLDGWGIPMATDIAFALAVLAVVGRHLPTPLRTFLLTLATVDDICAVLIIAVAYTSAVNVAALAVAIIGVALFAIAQSACHPVVIRLRTAVPGWMLFGSLAVVIWAATHASGVHATVAGVAIGLAMRTEVRGGERLAPSHRAEKVLRPLSSGIALPVFALLSAGVSLGGGGGFWTSTVTWGVLGGLLLGKSVGIFGAAWFTARFTSAHLNPRLAWLDVAGVGVLGAIGFTVSLLVAELSYSDAENLTHAKGAILMASVIASVVAAIFLGWRSRYYRDTGGKAISESAPQMKNT